MYLYVSFCGVSCGVETSDQCNEVPSFDAPSKRRQRPLKSSCPSCISCINGVPGQPVAPCPHVPQAWWSWWPHLAFGQSNPRSFQVPLAFVNSRFQGHQKASRRCTYERHGSVKQHRLDMRLCSDFRYWHIWIYIFGTDASNQFWLTLPMSSKVLASYLLVDKSIRHRQCYLYVIVATLGIIAAPVRHQSRQPLCFQCWPARGPWN